MEFTFLTPWGGVSAAYNEVGLCRLDLPLAEQREDTECEHSLAQATAQQVNEYLRGERQAFQLPIDWRVLGKDGSFLRRAYQACATIPYGQWVTYGDLAALAGSPKAARAAGQAMAKNPISLLIP